LLGAKKRQTAPSKFIASAMWALRTLACLYLYRPMIAEIGNKLYDRSVDKELMWLKQ